ncbi:MAG: hypothetical protein ACYTCU_11360, partial [Planctomycetota bacterium]
MTLALQDVTPAFFTLVPGAPNDVLGAWLICFFTLAVFSFLYRDNPFYKTAEHVFVGLGTAYFTLQYYKEGIWQPVVEYMRERSAMAEGELYSLGGLDIEPWLAIGLRIIPLLLGLMLLWRLVSANSWAPRWPLAIMVGVYAALKMTGETQSKLVLLIANAMTPLTDPTKVGWDEWTKIEQWEVFYTFSKVVFFVGLLCALGHFLFTYKRTPLLAGVSRIGVITLMITFGSMFGFTVLGRIALLIERVDHL